MKIIRYYGKINVVKSIMEQIDIISFKHDGSLHRVWKDVDKLYEDDDICVIINNEVDVIDGDGRFWKTKEPAVCYFFKKHWFNVICMLRNESIQYYCNLSSPYVIDQEGLKYIDYDLDLKVFSDGKIIELDRDEFEFNIKNFHYSEKIIGIIEKNKDLLLERIANKDDPFTDECVLKWYNLYKSSLNKN